METKQNKATHTPELLEAAKPAGRFYVTLWERTSRYGGPEEGGWWINDSIPVAYQEFATEEAANVAREMVEQLARELSQQAHRSHDESCLRSMEWLDARGLEADFLPEPDGPTEFYVGISAAAPEPSYGPTHYE